MNVESLATVALSYTQSTLAKPIVTTAPSSVQQNTHPISQAIPPLKQKTGIVKSKVPPPVPPRGSPRYDRRTSTGSQKSSQVHGISPRNMSPGTRNYLNDKYFDTIQPNPNNLCRLTPLKLYNLKKRRASAPLPIFGFRRSPTCVQDWLQINDFAASDYDETVVQTKELDTSPPPLIARPPPARPITIKTAHLQKQDSFRNSSYCSDISVRSLVERYSKKTRKGAIELELKQPTTTKITTPMTMTMTTMTATAELDENCIRRNFVSDRIKAYRIDSETMVHSISAPNVIPTIQIQSTEPAHTILKRLKRRTTSANPQRINADDTHTNYVQKNEILKTHSNVHESNGSRHCHDAFSLDGEFV